MWIMTPADRQELEAYRALGTVEELRERVRVPFPTTDDYAPLPLSDHDPARDAADRYECGWPDVEERTVSGLLCEEG